MATILAKLATLPYGGILLQRGCSEHMIYA